MSVDARFWINHGQSFPYDERVGGDNAHKAALGILANLCDRRGIKWELQGCDDDVRREIVDTLSAIIREAMA